MCGEVLPEQEDALAQCSVLEGAQVRVGGPEPLRLGTCLRQQFRVREIGDLELGQAALARAEEVARIRLAAVLFTCIWAGISTLLCVDATRRMVDVVNAILL